MEYNYDYSLPRVPSWIDCIGMVTNMTYDTGPGPVEIADEPILVQPTTQLDPTTQTEPPCFPR